MSSSDEQDDRVYCCFDDSDDSDEQDDRVDWRFDDSDDSDEQAATRVFMVSGRFIHEHT